ncbi:MAG: chloride channel protein [Promethearchaeota archaeon]
MNPLTKKTPQPSRRNIDYWLKIYFFAAIIGVIGGGVAILLRVSIDALRIFFLDFLLPLISINVGEFNLGLLLLPVIGALIVGPIIAKLAPETKGSGIPFLFESMILKGGKIRDRVGLAKIFVSSITIASGGNGGIEGPIALVGANMGSIFGSKLHLNPMDKRLLMTCGLAAGIAGSFNAPFGGALFGLEILFQGVTIIESIPVFFAAALGAMIANLYFKTGHRINFTLNYVNPSEYGFFLVLGIIFAFIAFFWVKFFYGVSLSFNKIKIPNWLKPSIGALCTGIIILFTPMGMGLYGTGISGMEFIIENPFVVPSLYLIFGILKMISTAATIGSGGSGGIFGPSLYMGYMFGGFFGYTLESFFPDFIANPQLYCFIGMASFFAASTVAPLNISFIIAEMTGCTFLIPPLLVSSITSYFISKIFLLHESSIYTLHLKRGETKLKSDTIFKMENVRVNEIMTTNLITVSPDLPILEFARISSEHGDINQFPVLDFGKLEGIAFIDDLFRINYEQWDSITVKEIMKPIRYTIEPDKSLQNCMDLMHEHNLRAVLVIKESINDRDEKELILLGIISQNDIIRAWEQKKE